MVLRRQALRIVKSSGPQTDWSFILLPFTLGDNFEDDCLEFSSRQAAAKLLVEYRGPPMCWPKLPPKDGPLNMQFPKQTKRQLRTGLIKVSTVTITMTVTIPRITITKTFMNA